MAGPIIWKHLNAFLESIKGEGANLDALVLILQVSKNDYLFYKKSTQKLTETVWFLSNVSLSG